MTQAAVARETTKPQLYQVLLHLVIGLGAVSLHFLLQGPLKRSGDSN